MKKVILDVYYIAALDWNHVLICVLLPLFCRNFAIVTIAVIFAILP